MNFRLAILAAIAWGMSIHALPPEKLAAAAKLRTYCKACHAVDELRFIRSDNDEEMWNTIFSEKSPKSGRLWAEQIMAVLDWPTDAAPPFDSPMTPNADWMPKGFKRIQLAEDVENGRPVRRQILEALRSGP